MFKTGTSLFAVLCCVSLLVSSAARRPLFRAARDADTTGRYIVMLKQDIDHEQFQRILRQAVSLSNDKRPYGVVETVEKSFTLTLNSIALEIIQSIPNVDHVEEEQMAFGSQDPNLPWHLDRIDQNKGPRDYQYNPQNNGEGVDVYVLDTGINYDHEEFERRAKYGGYDAVDDYYDDEPPQKGRDCQGHGTHVSSLVGGKTFGTAKKVNLYSVRVLDCFNFAPWSIVIAGMDYVAKRMIEQKRPMVVVMSLGGPHQPAANEAIKNLNLLGAIVVVAAGNGKNDACKTSPAGSEYSITVGATNETDELYWNGSGTNYGTCVDIFAPGEFILAANHSCVNCTKVLSGTSMATPMVAGIIAMYLQDQPLLNTTEVKQKLINQSVTDVIDFSSFTDEAKTTTPNRLVQVHGGCGGTYRYRTQLNITSPNYPNNYPRSQVCEWKIMAEKDQEITLTILDMDLEQEYDYLLVCDGQECRYDNIKARYTGNITTLMKNSSIEFTVRSSSQYLSVLLLTDSAGGGRGFLATFTKFYKGTPLIVKDSGMYLSSQPSLPVPGKYPAHTIEGIGIMANDETVNMVSKWTSDGYMMSWVNTRTVASTGVWFYDFLFHNSSVERNKGYVEINATKLKHLVEIEKANGLIVEVIAARLSGENILYGIVFKEHSHLIESYSFTGMKLYDSVVTRDKLIEAGWTMVCHHLLPLNDVMLVSAVFHRDKRRRYGITEGLDEPQTLAYYGFDFYQFTSISLVLSLRKYYPRYVSSYHKDGQIDNRISVIYEERVAGGTFYNWFRWGLNVTEVTRDVAYYTSYSPTLLTSYVYNGHTNYMVVWGIKIK